MFGSFLFVLTRSRISLLHFFELLNHMLVVKLANVWVTVDLPSDFFQLRGEVIAVRIREHGGNGPGYHANRPNTDHH